MIGATGLPLWAFDTEDDSKGSPIMFNFFDGERHVTHKTREAAIGFLINEVRRAEMWAVNCEYDLNNLFGDEAGAAFLERTYLKSAFIKARMVDLPERKMRVVFYDTLRHWKLSVEKMGNRLGLPKHPFDPYSQEYCRRDTEITFRWIAAQAKNYAALGAKVGSTIGASALGLWKRAYMKHSPELADREARAFLSEAVRGGRVEIFRTGLQHGRIDCFDVNSMYPYVMRNMEFPKLDSMCWTRFPDYDGLGAAEVEIVYPETAIPCLPHMADNPRKLLFPVGRLRGTWCYPEIRQALIDGARVTWVYNAVEFTESCRPFASYIDDLYKRRKATDDELEKDTLKNFMNNLFGKFGAKNVLEIWRGWECEEREMISPDANQIWAAYVTCYARLHLLKMLRKYAPWLLYCDTDSLFLKDGPKVECSNELGAFKHVGTWGSADFVLPKVYMLARGSERTFKVKGVPKRAAAEFYDKHEAEFEAPIRHRESFKRGIKANVWMKKSRALNQQYDKRRVLAGGATEPICIGL